MDAKEAFAKISTDCGAISLAKLIQAGQVENPFSRQEWDGLLAFQAAANFPDCSKAQAFSRYLNTEVGRQLYWASKCLPAFQEDLAKVAEPGAEDPDDEPELAPQSVLADQRYGRRLTLQQARALGPNKARRVDMSVRGAGDQRTVQQQNKPYSNPNPPARKQLDAEGESRRAYLQSLHGRPGESVAQFRT